MRKLQLKIMLLMACALVLMGAGAHSAFAAQAKEKTSKPKAASAQKSDAPVDLNTASEKELNDLPGVGPATAKKIIAGRPYSSVDGLSKAGVSAATIKKITPLVSVSGGKAAEATTADSGKKSSTKSKKAESTKKSSEASAQDETPAAKPAPAAAKSPDPAPAPPAKTAAATTPRAAPGPGTVWVNTESGVYHYSNSRYYGKTAKGKYMSEADAAKAGYHAAENEKKPQ